MWLNCNGIANLLLIPQLEEDGYVLDYNTKRDWVVITSQGNDQAILREMLVVMQGTSSHVYIAILFTCLVGVCDRSDKPWVQYIHKGCPPSGPQAIQDVGQGLAGYASPPRYPHGMVIIPSHPLMGGLNQDPCPSSEKFSLEITQII